MKGDIELASFRTTVSVWACTLCDSSFRRDKPKGARFYLQEDQKIRVENGEHTEHVWPTVIMTTKARGVVQQKK